MLRIVLVRPGCTDFDQQGRIKGTLDIPLSEDGSRQAAHAADELASLSLDMVYSAPCRSALQTAETIAAARRVKVKVVDDLHNVDHGLWHGKRIDEVKETQPRLYRQGQEHADSICPPQGEPIAAGRERVRRALGRLLKKHRSGVLCLVVPEPLTSVVESELQQCQLADLWKCECDNGRWNVYEVVADPTSVFRFRGVSQAVPEPAFARREARLALANKRG
jgi:broad specificity phosphatase PhoE